MKEKSISWQSRRQRRYLLNLIRENAGD